MTLLMWYQVLLVFFVGAAVGSFVNVVVSRLPLEKNLIWPGSRCGSCLQPIRWYDNLPLVSYLWLRGRCRTCGAKFSARYFLVELGMALGFVGLFYLELVRNVHQWPEGWQGWAIRQGFFPQSWWLGYGYHAILFSFLTAAAVCDLQGREIPFSLTLTGTMIGLIGATLFSWPWPWMPAEATPSPGGFGPPGDEWKGGLIRQGIYAWPVWGPLPDFLAPGGNWQTGLATGLVGALVGTFMMRAIAFLFSAGLGKEALGMGDAVLWMMAGAFLGWQPLVAGFFVSVVPALVFAAVNVIVYRDNSLPFGPSLAAGAVIVMLFWHWIGPPFQPIYFWGQIIMWLTIAMLVFMFVSSFVIRLVRQAARPRFPRPSSLA